MSASVPPGATAHWVELASRGGAQCEPPRGRSPLTRVGAQLAFLAAAALMAGSYFAPWWSFTLYAPQYPRGLRLIVSLSRVTGDVHEVNMLNHYIGMKSLTHAAPIERAIAGYAVPALALTVLLAAVLLRGRWKRLAIAGAALLPLGFLVDSWLWLRHFGHQLDPRAPIKLAAFTPELFGNGEIGQFMTFARPDLGFLLALSAPMLVACGVWLAGPGARVESNSERG
ncbi:MAG: cytochrome C [Myxococcota bacterium]